MFGRKLKTQKENVISAQEETLDMHPVIHVADSIIEYQKQLAEREVESLDEMADIQKAFVLATKENERLKDQVQELSSVFADVGQIATSFDGVKNEIVDSVGEAQQKIDELIRRTNEEELSFVRPLCNGNDRNGFNFLYRYRRTGFRLRFRFKG